jgi:tRNA threonylcarbamoyladenosine biosynthesis protein TsaE
VNPSTPPVRTVAVETRTDMERLGRRLAALLRAGDLVVLTGDLGAGKTALARGIGAGMDVRGDVTSPTFVIARVHRSRGAGPDLVHVDAYRLGGLAEVDDLDLDASLPDSVTVVEWGLGRVESLADDRLEVTIHRPRGASEHVVEDGDEPRTVVLRGIGPRWADVVLPGEPVGSADA